MAFLESVTEKDQSVGGTLMTRLYPIASRELIHEICDAIELWLERARSRQLSERLKELAADPANHEMANRYRGWAEIIGRQI
jgi:hypothetical protein